MLFEIDAASAKPVYQQVIDQVKYAIAAGRLRAGERLPTIRDVAVQTRVNRNTIARAYMDLEREGVIRSRAGQGSFVSEDGAGGAGAVTREYAERILEQKVDELLAQARQFRLSEAELMALIKGRVEKVEL